MRATCLISQLLAIPFCCGVADTHYVSWFGSNTPPYTSWETAAWFISFANEASGEGDTIYIDAGGYYLTMSISLKSVVHVKPIRSRIGCHVSVKTRASSDPCGVPSLHAGTDAGYELK